MAPAGWPAPPLLSRLLGRRRRPPIRPVSGGSDAAVASDHPGIARAATLRRLVFGLLVLAQTAAFAYYMTTKLLPYHGQEPLELAILSLSTILFVWISLGFWTALSGFALLSFARDRHAITDSVAPDAIIPRKPAPRDHADLQRARGARLRRAPRHLRVARRDRRGIAIRLLRPERQQRARHAHGRAPGLVRALRGRRRIRADLLPLAPQRIKRKSGNVADFCRRWGSQYRYMIVLDADSVMSGTSLTSLVRMMEANRRPGSSRRRRARPGATRCTRAPSSSRRASTGRSSPRPPLLAAREAPYWGHNAIIRIAPFMQHCALGRLPGRGPLAGEILSHDFVEAALMRRAGWKVWMAYDLPGSYEEIANLLDEVKRDRRCATATSSTRASSCGRASIRASRGVHDRDHDVRVRAALAPLADGVDRLHPAPDGRRPAVLRRAAAAVPDLAEWDAGSAIGFAVGRRWCSSFQRFSARRSCGARCRRVRRRATTHGEPAAGDRPVRAAGADPDALHASS